ncbi:unnamed protein product [Adineta steineri]|uniref:Uncharacterized protein n=1 Tax=Adineta steineri TaxID=433720 RepID=A0A819MTC4_9BILA|nr:unnamed protein product [Adineta steineri]CAF0900522.1 unnamed protein product [Adineta steineri]CAF0919652.1 unnamed protein product [Adineta steineri]CAF3510068.1 unnamed protein product [Adineta steineri]CAF3962549.1 unnamed protein product [Adineta steineri]
MLSSSTLAYRILPYASPYHSESYQDIAPLTKMMIAIPNEVDAVWPQYAFQPINQIADERIRRGWGNGRRRRRSVIDQD